MMGITRMRLAPTTPALAALFSILVTLLSGLTGKGPTLSRRPMMKQG